MRPPDATSASLTSLQLHDLQVGDGTSYDAGLTLLQDGQETDITDLLDLTGSSVSWDGRQQVHRRCTLQLRGPLDWPTARVRPHMTLSRAGRWARWDLGTFLADGPGIATSDDDQLIACQGLDKLTILDTPIGRTWAAEAGDTYLAAAEQLLREIDPDGPDAPLTVQADGLAITLPTSRLFDPTDTYLTVINELLYAVGYRAIWVDVDGTYRFDVYQPPVLRSAEFEYSFDDLSIVMPDRAEQADYWAVPNQWIFVLDRPSQGTAGTGTDGTDGRYVFTNTADGPTSLAGRGGIVRRKGPVGVDAATPEALIARATEIIQADRRVVARRSYITDANPAHGHFDVAHLDDPILGAGNGYWTGWALPLDGTTPMTHAVEMVA